MLADHHTGGALGATSDAVERALGDCVGAGGPLSLPAAMLRDERESFPEDAISILRDRGLAKLHVPVAHGGRQTSLEQLLSLSRGLARRDPAVALTSGMALWSQLVWMAGSAAQRARVSEVVLDGGALCFAASERAHGADLLAGETTAVRAAGGYTISGEKWPIGCANRAPLALVLAKTADSGPRSLSWFLLDKEALPKGTCTPLPKVPTLGLRAAELAGLSFDGVALPEASRIGAEGEGLELTLKTFQITRPLATSLSLGITDTALRLAALFASRRRLYGGAASAIPAVRASLAGAFAELLAADVLAIAALRGAHVAPGELSVTSNIAKAVVPALCERALSSAKEVLGARFYLREGFAAGVFQKLLRDHGAVPLFDGSTAVCLQALGAQLPSLLKPQRQVDVRARDERLALRFRLDREVGPFAPGALTLFARGEDDVLRGFGDVAARAADGELPEGVSPSAAPRLRLQIAALRRALDDLGATFVARSASSGAPLGRTAALAHFARRYAQLHAAAACVHQLFHGASLGPFLRGGDWLVVALARALDPDAPIDDAAGAESIDHVATELFARVTTPRMLGVVDTAPRRDPRRPLTRTEHEKSGSWFTTSTKTPSPPSTPSSTCWRRAPPPSPTTSPRASSATASGRPRESPMARSPRAGDRARALGALPPPAIGRSCSIRPASSTSPRSSAACTRVCSPSPRIRRIRLASSAPCLDCEPSSPTARRAWP